MSDEHIASAFVAARRANRPLAAFPGAVPQDLADAYSIQRAAIDQWPARIGGWKVGRVAAQQVASIGAARFIGPIFEDTIQNDHSIWTFHACAGGFAALETEIVLRLAENAPADKIEWAAQEAAGLIGEVFIAIEVAGSPLSSVNSDGALVSIAAFGNNMGLLLGPAIAIGLDRLGDVSCSAYVDGQLIRSARADVLPGGPLAAFAFALGEAARHGTPMKRGQLVSTGAITGIIPVEIGQECVADFGAFGRLRCVVTPPMRLTGFQ